MGAHAAWFRWRRCSGNEAGRHEPNCFRAWPITGGGHGAWDDAQGYVEGSLAGVVEAAAGSPLLPSVKAEPGFLCGTEFDNLRSEVAFFERHSLSLEAVTVEVDLSPWATARVRQPRTRPWPPRLPASGRAAAVGVR